MSTQILRAALVAVFFAANVLSASPVRAELSAEQKQKLCALLALPAVRFQVNFQVTRRGGFALEQEDPKAAARTRLKQAAPSSKSSPLTRARFVFIQGLDYQTIEDKDKATASLATAEQLSREAAVKATGVDKARLLSLQADARLVQDQPEEALALARKAAQVAPAAWEPQEVLGAIYTEALTTTAKASHGKKGVEGLTVLDRMDRLNRQATQAFQMAVTLLEKSQPDVRKRDVQPYLTRIGSFFMLPYYQSWIKAQRQGVEAGKPAAETSFDYVTVFRRPDFQHDLQSALAIDSQNPYATGFNVMAQSLQKPLSGAFFIPSGVQTGAQEKLKTIYDDPTQSADRRAQACLTAGALYAMSNDMGHGVPLLAKGLTFAPDNEVLQLGYAICLTAQTPPRYDEAKDFLNKQIATRPTSTLRLLLAKIHEKQDDLAHAQDVIEAALAADPNAPAVQVAAAAVRLKQSAKVEAAELQPSGLLLQSVGRNNPGLSGPPWTAFVETTIVFYALYGQLDNAKTTSQTLLTRDPDNQIAKTLLSFVP